MKNKLQIQFFEYYHPVHNQLVLYCRAVAGNRHDAEDLVHDVVVRAIEGFNKIPDKHSFKPYLFGIASNLHKMHLRRKKFHASFDPEEAQLIRDASQNPEVLADYQIIYNKIMELPAKTAETIILFHISDLKLEDIQKIQGGSLSGVKLRLKRGREKLLNMLNSPAQVKNAILFLSL